MKHRPSRSDASRVTRGASSARVIGKGRQAAMEPVRPPWPQSATRLCRIRSGASDQPGMVTRFPSRHIADTFGLAG